MLVESLAQKWTKLDPILQDNLAETDGEPLPHLILSDMVRWMEAHFGTDLKMCVEVWDWLGEQYLRGDDSVKNLIAVSGIEMLPDPDEPGGAELRAILPRYLLELDPWR
ncbi:DUF7674 family protein [Cellulomonas chengniuliangii]|uniref:DUF7674 family protein n=1 Tax=Cellulomonas chengniuliangii TaxID=2968084 RepID=UPI001D0E93F0|nr:hypothetical protein [Cellulomonas chengniuliangii]MCC2317038.1 hypothetical protein [Cellulomonas chengniuliangii]